MRQHFPSSLLRQNFSTFAPELDLYRLHTLRVTQSDDSWGALAVVCDVRCRLFVAFVCDVRCSLFAFQREGRRRMVGSLSFSQSSQECTASASGLRVVITHCIAREDHLAHASTAAWESLTKHAPQRTTQRATARTKRAPCIVSITTRRREYYAESSAATRPEAAQALDESVGSKESHFPRPKKGILVLHHSSFGASPAPGSSRR